MKGITADGVIHPAEKRALREYRSVHHISQEQVRSSAQEFSFPTMRSICFSFMGFVWKTLVCGSWGRESHEQLEGSHRKIMEGIGDTDGCKRFVTGWVTQYPIRSILGIQGKIKQARKQKIKYVTSLNEEIT